MPGKAAGCAGRFYTGGFAGHHLALYTEWGGWSWTPNLESRARNRAHSSRMEEDNVDRVSSKGIRDSNARILLPFFNSNSGTQAHIYKVLPQLPQHNPDSGVGGSCTIVAPLGRLYAQAKWPEMGGGRNEWWGAEMNQWDKHAAIFFLSGDTLEGFPLCIIESNAFGHWIIILKWINHSLAPLAPSLPCVTNQDDSPL